MTNKGSQYDQIINKTVIINAPAAKVWEALTNLELLQKWMADEEITIVTDWTVGGPIVIKGDMHWVYFENTGKVLQFEPEKVLKYSHLSSLSRLPDEEASYTIIEFRLSPVENGTTLWLTISNFPTETIFRHNAFYWNTAIELLKASIEKLEP